MTAVDRLLGSGEQVECRVVSDLVSVHWYPTDAGPGDPCLCGELRKKDDADRDRTARAAEAAGG